jgi:PBSX family phage portal protein
MSKRNRRKAKENLAVTEPDQKMQAFTFGEPSAVLDRRDILDYTECVGNGKWIEPPISFSGLAKSLRAAVHHSSPIYVKRNILASTYIPHPLLSQQDFSRFVLDYLVFGNAFLEKRFSVTGKLLKLETSPAKYTRRGVDPSVYWFVQSFVEPHPFAPDSVFHLLEPDINQELYGMPEYLSALNSAWLNESATLFRRKYYQNGAHAGYIMYVASRSSGLKNTASKMTTNDKSAA